MNNFWFSFCSKKNYQKMFNKLHRYFKKAFNIFLYFFFIFLVYSFCTSHHTFRKKSWKIDKFYNTLHDFKSICTLSACQSVCDDADGFWFYPKYLGIDWNHLHAYTESSIGWIRFLCITVKRKIGTYMTSLLLNSFLKFMCK